MGRTSSARRLGGEGPEAGANEGEEDRLEVAAGGGVREDDPGELRAVHRSVGGEDARAEAGDDGGNGRTAGGLQLMHDVVGVEKTNAKFPEELGKRGLPAGDAACEGDSHDRYFASGAGVAFTSLSEAAAVVSES